jgi:hypothetical protein
MRKWPNCPLRLEAGALWQPILPAFACTLDRRIAQNGYFGQFLSM